MNIDKIKVLLTDVDGVLTDGCVQFDQTGKMISKKFNFKDLTALERIKNNNIHIIAITGCGDINTEVLKPRGIPVYVVDASKDNKVNYLNIIKRRYQCTTDEIMYIGDDVQDYEIMLRVGIAVCPKDAIEPIKKISDIVLSRCGGDGAMAELANWFDPVYRCTE